MLHYELLVIGGGPGGIEAARRGAEAGLKTALVHNAPIGGRAIWSSLLPSKAWLQVAETVHKAIGHPVLSNLKVLQNGYSAGRIRVHFDVNTGLILGAAAFGHHAAEALSLIQLAINTGLTWEQVSRTPYAHPSLAEVWSA